MSKILFVVDERKMGGVSNVLEKIVKSFPKQTFDILVLHNNGDKLDNIDNVNLIYGTPFFNVVDLPLKEVIKSKKIVKIIKKIYLIFLLKTGLIKNKIIKERKKMSLKKYDIEISFKDGFGTYFVAYGNAAEKIRWLHADYSNNDPGRKYQKSYTKAIEQYDKIIAISQGVANNFNKKYHKESITDIIYNLIDKKLPKREKENNKVFNLVAVGRLNHIKGYDRLLNVINKLNKENLCDSVSLKIVGSGEMQESLQNLIKQYNLESIVKLLGASNKPWELIKDGDLFILCSKSEAFPLTVIESQLVGIPVLATEYSSAKEMITKEHGIIIKNNEEALYNELKKILLNKKIVKKLQDNIKNYDYSNDKIIKKIERTLKIYEKDTN